MGISYLALLSFFKPQPALYEGARDRVSVHLCASVLLAPQTSGIQQSLYVIAKLLAGDGSEPGPAPRKRRNGVTSRFLCCYRVILSKSN